MKAKHDDLVRALTGMMFGDHHAHLARMLLNLIGYLDESRAPGGQDRRLPGPDPRRPGRGRDGATGPAPAPGRTPPSCPRSKRLAEIPGVSQDLARAIIGETGLDMTRFPTAAHLVSWAGLAPVARQSGPRTRKAKRARATLPARPVHPGRQRHRRTDTFLGERLRRLAKRRGGARAQVAVARSILIIIWHLLADPEARFTDLGPGLARPQNRQGQEDPQPPPPVPGSRLEVTLTPRPPRTNTRPDQARSPSRHGPPDPRPG